MMKQLNLPRVNARDSCFSAPSNPGSSTGFRPTSRRPLSLALHYGHDALDAHSYNYIPSAPRESHFCFYTCNTVLCLENTFLPLKVLYPFPRTYTSTFAKNLSILHRLLLMPYALALFPKALSQLNFQSLSYRGF
jgi:hypothetical protein